MNMLKSIKVRINVFFQYKDLLYNLVSRDIKVRYRKSFLGMLWTVLNPLLMMIVMTIVFSTLFKSTIDNFPVYFLAGNLIFTLNSEITNNCTYAIIGNASLLKKVYIPKYLFPLSKAGSALVNLMFSLIAMFLVMIILRVPFLPTLLLLPIPIAYAFIFSLGLGLLLSAVTVYFRDIAYFYSVLLLAWNYFTPVFYPIEILPDFARKLMQLNPLYHYIDYMRNLILHGVVPGITENFVCLLMSVMMLVIGVCVFYRKQDNFILYI
jgi:ABC-2 type transport system permease protein